MKKAYENAIWHKLSNGSHIASKVANKNYLYAIRFVLFLVPNFRTPTISSATLYFILFFHLIQMRDFSHTRIGSLSPGRSASSATHADSISSRSMLISTNRFRRLRPMSSWNPVKKK